MMAIAPTPRDRRSPARMTATTSARAPVIFVPFGR